MKLPRDCMIELCSDKERKGIKQPYLKGNKLIATNARSLVVLTVDRAENDKDGFINPLALSAARKVTRKKNSIEIKADKEELLTAGQSFSRLPENQDNGFFPNYEPLIVRHPEKSHQTIIGLDAKLLYDMQRAMGANSVCLRIQSPESPIVVRPDFRASAPDAKGLLMPTKLSM